ncbi:MAG: hypothetical protein RLY20_961 [Verrucomicrobiota bacterium]
MKPELERSEETFVAIARNFCEWAENPSLEQEEDFKTAMRLLPKLYAAAILLRESGGDDSKWEEIPDDQLRMVYHRFGKLPFNAYGVCFNPLVIPPEEPCVGSLVDDLGDIYRDVKRALVHYQSGHREQAVWEWRFHFKCHWGRHLSSALHALHAHAEVAYWWPVEYSDETD